LHSHALLKALSDEFGFAPIRADELRVFDGIAEVVTHKRERGLRVAVLSRPERAMRRHSVDPRDVVYVGTSCATSKPVRRPRLLSSCAISARCSRLSEELGNSFGAVLGLVEPDQVAGVIHDDEAGVGHSIGELAALVGCGKRVPVPPQK
jgi:hypothetical protein